MFDPVFSLVEKALDVSSLRQQAIAQNISNINTPGYKRSEVPFPAVLAEIMREYRSGQEEAQARAESGRMSPMEVGFLKAELQFERAFQGQGAENRPGGSASTVLSGQIQGVQPEVIVQTGGIMRYDGNNVNIDLAIADMTKNSQGYGALTSIMSGDFRLLRTVIEAR